MEKLAKPILFGLFVAHSISFLVVSPTFERGLTFAILAIIMGLLEFKATNKAIDSLRQEIETLKKESEEQKKFGQELSSHVSSIKMGQQIKTAGRF